MIDPKLQAILDMQKDIPDVNIKGIGSDEIASDDYVNYLLGDITISDNSDDFVEFSDTNSEGYID